MNIILGLIAERIDPRAARQGSLLQRVTHLVELRRKRETANVTIPRAMYKPPADCMESAVGALFVMSGFDAVQDWVRKTFSPLVDLAMRLHQKRYENEVLRSIQRLTCAPKGSRNEEMGNRYRAKTGI